MREHTLPHSVRRRMVRCLRKSGWAGHSRDTKAPPRGATFEFGALYLVVTRGTAKFVAHPRVAPLGLLPGWGRAE